MTQEEMIEQLENTILLIKQNDKDWLDERDIPILEEAIKAMKSEQRWIPVSERLPNENGDYFVTLENGVVKILGYSTTQRTTYPKGFYYISNGFSWRQTINPVIAWMPLPEHYKEEVSE